VKPSPQLVKEVLGMYVLPYDIAIKDEIMAYTWDNSTGSSDGYIDIHNFANMCKEWAFTDAKCTLSSGKALDGGWFAIDGISGKCHTADTEPEAVMVASKWIMDHI